jgi:hypothetical protein
MAGEKQHHDMMTRELEKLRLSPVTPESMKQMNDILGMLAQQQERMIKIHGKSRATYEGGQ